MLATRARCALSLTSVAALSAGMVAVAHAASPTTNTADTVSASHCTHLLETDKSRGVSLTGVIEPGVSLTGVSLTDCAGTGVSLT